MFKPHQAHSPAKKIRRILKFDTSTESSPSSIKYNEMDTKLVGKENVFGAEIQKPVQRFKKHENLSDSFSNINSNGIIHLLPMSNDFSSSESSTPVPLKTSHKKSPSLENGLSSLIQFFMKKPGVDEGITDNAIAKCLERDVEVASPALPHSKLTSERNDEIAVQEMEHQKQSVSRNRNEPCRDDSTNFAELTLNEVEQNEQPIFSSKRSNFRNSISKIQLNKSDSQKLFSQTWPLKNTDLTSESVRCSEELSKQRNYESLEVVGEGCFGIVYKCKSKLDLKLYAIKQSIRKAKGSYHLNLALNEAENLKMLDSLGGHPNIIKYYDSWTENQSLFLVLEYCPSNLQRLWKEREIFAEEEIYHILCDMAEGLNFLHSNKVVHLDIKPDNILIDESGNFKLADFGQSRVLAPELTGDVEEGDGKYMAPELLNLRSEGTDTTQLAKADIFSLGVTLYEIVTNSEAPARGPEWHALRNGEFTALENSIISQPLKTLIGQMLNRNPLLRPSADEILQQLSQLTNELKHHEVLKKGPIMLKLYERSNSL